MSREDFFQKPKIDPTKKPNPLTSLKFKKLNPHDSISLCWRPKENVKFWRYRYQIASTNFQCFQHFEDFEFERFKTIEEFAKFIDDYPLKDKQMTVRGVHRIKTDTDENRKDYQ